MTLTAEREAQKRAWKSGKRLCEAQQQSDMTVSDLALWFRRPRSTVKTWLAGRTPLGPSGRRALWCLTLLEWAIKHKQGLPVPDTISGTKRPKYVREQRDAAERYCNVSSVRAA